MTAPTVNVASHLARMAALDPDRPAIHFPTRAGYVARTFSQLNADVDALAHGLTAVGISRGTRVALMVPPSPEFFALTFALFKVAAVPVFIDPGMGIKNLGVCLGEAEPAAFVGIAKAHLARRIFGWAKASIRTAVNVGRRRFFCTHSTRELSDIGMSLGPFASPEVSPDDPAAILFTSGSTGIAKGAEYTHGIFSAQVEMLKATYGIEPGEVDFCTFPLFALFGPALGMTCVIPEMDFSRPATIDAFKAMQTIRQFGATNFFGSPAVVRALASGGREPPVLVGEKTRGLRPPLACLRRAISAGAPASPPVLEDFSRLLSPSTEIFTPYGATEALPVANVGSREILDETRFLTEQGKGVCVGKPVAGMRVYVVPISEDAIPDWDESICLAPGEIGEFVVRGQVVTKAYFKRPEQTQLAKIRDPHTGEILHRMGDVGYLDEQGRLWYCGRKSHRVVTPTGTLYTEMVEGVFNTVDSVMKSALVGVRRQGVTHPVICIEQVCSRHFPGLLVRLERIPWPELAAQLRDRAKEFPHTTGIETFLAHPWFPVDVRHNSKIFREKLAAWADKKLGPKWNPGESQDSRGRIG